MRSYKKLKTIFDGTETRKEALAMLQAFIDGNVASLSYKFSDGESSAFLWLQSVVVSGSNTNLVFTSIQQYSHSIVQALITISSDEIIFGQAQQIGSYTPV